MNISSSNSYNNSGVSYKNKSNKSDKNNSCSCNSSSNSSDKNKGLTSKNDSSNNNNNNNNNIVVETSKERSRSTGKATEEMRDGKAGYDTRSHLTYTVMIQNHR